MVETANSWETKGVKTFKSKAADDYWVVTEKIHGANFSFHVDVLASGGLSVRCAKRDCVIEDDDDFFGYKDVEARHAQDVLNGARDILTAYPGGTSVTFYGELFGGRYPHPEVSKTEGATPVQQGVWYTPDVNWLCYDIRVVSPESSTYLPFKEVLSCCVAASIPHVKPLLTAPFNDCINFKIPFQSTVPAIYGLPLLPSNTAEGIVVKGFCKDVEVPLAGGKKKTRGIIKIKADEFSEWSDKANVAQTAAAGDHTALVRSCVNTNRLNCVLSKHGKLTAKTKPTIIKKMIADIQEDISSSTDAATAATLLPEITSQVTAFVQKQ
eukprot:TRINITY_DN10794_c0_g1_i1.p1 TRINITY_DN10794_c0_g1~~TRINITY_DN10794_c0_g1_i1.p1  ORF type:complete len:349 (+),score=91.51 TRINITY_DN10794_c0_g1_i1:73-1047(+)